MEAFGWLIYRGAKGIPPATRKAAQQKATAADIKSWARRMNARRARSKTAQEAKAAALARAADSKTAPG